VEIFDFGQVSAHRDFTEPVANLVRNAPLNVGRILSPLQPSFVRPHPGLAVDQQLCIRHSVNAYGFYAAQAFRRPNRGMGQRGIERLLRIARVRALRHGMRWAQRRVAEARRS
jgi:hypothetical protein